MKGNLVSPRKNPPSVYNPLVNLVFTAGKTGCKTHEERFLRFLSFLSPQFLDLGILGIGF